MICFIPEDNEIFNEQQKETLQLFTNVNQQFIFATSPWKHGHCMMKEYFQNMTNETIFSIRYEIN